MIRGPEFEAVNLDGKSPLGYCYFCKHHIKHGELMTTVSWENPWRYGKQRKKLAKVGLLYRTHIAHAACPKEQP